MTDMSEISGVLQRLNKTFATLPADYAPSTARNFGTMSFTGSSYVESGTDFLVDTEKLKPYGIRISSVGNVCFLFKGADDMPYDFVSVSVAGLEEYFSEAFEPVYLEFDRIHLMRAASLSNYISTIGEKLFNKPALISQVNGGLLGQSIDILEEQADLTEKSRQEFYESDDTFGIF